MGRNHDGNERVLLVEVASLSYLDYKDFVGVVVYLIAHAPISHANSPNALFTSDFQTPMRVGVGGKRQDSRHDAVLDRPVKAL